MSHIGHCWRIHTLLKPGFGSSEPISVGSNELTSGELFAALLRKKMAFTAKAVTLRIIDFWGVRQGKKQLFHSKIIDSFDENDNITGTMRMSAYPLSIVAQLLVGERIAARGVVPPQIYDRVQDLIGSLAKRGIRIDGYFVGIW